MRAPHCCGAMTTLPSNCSAFVQYTKTRPHRLPTQGSIRIQHRLKITVRHTQATTSLVPTCRRANARCGVINPPLQPRCFPPLMLNDDSCGSERRMLKDLKLEEEAKCPPVAPEGDITLMLVGHVYSPVRPYPLSPVRGIVVDNKVEKEIGRAHV